MMIASTISPHITPTILKSLYESLRRLKPIPDHPLLNLMLVRQQRLAWNETITSQQALYDVLIDLLITEFNKVRAVHHFSPVKSEWSVREAQDDLAGLGMCCNERLLACSVAYYRYGRSDLGLSIGEITTYLGHDDRNLRRFINDFWRYLCRVLIRLEREARLDVRHLSCQLALPRWRLVRLPDQDCFAESLARRLADADPACLLIYGPSGIGKSVVALRMAHHLIERETIDDVVWLNIAASLADMSPAQSNLARSLCQGLGLVAEPLTVAVDKLTRYVHQRCAQGERLLVILDDVARWEAVIHSLWHVLGHCVLIATTRSRFRLWHGLSVACPVLSEADTEAVLRFWDEDRRRVMGWSDCEEFYARLMVLGQGNPGRLKQAYERWWGLQATPLYSTLDKRYHVSVS